MATKKQPAWLRKYWAQKHAKQRNVSINEQRLKPGKTRARVLNRTRRAVQSVVPSAKHGVVRFNPQTVVARANPSGSKKHRAQRRRAQQAWDSLMAGEMSGSQFDRFVRSGKKPRGLRSGRANPRRPKSSVACLGWMLGR